MSLAITSTSPAFTVAITPSGTPLQGNVASFQNLTTTGGTAPVCWAVVGGSLPAGIQLDPAGRLAGIATRRGSALVTLRATDSTSPIALFTDAAIVVTVS
jgi:hypothetical protein